MNNKLWIFGLVLLISACGIEKRGDDYLPVLKDLPIAFENLAAIANCTSPMGNYTTTVHSTADGYVYFRQDYEYRDTPFIAIVLDSLTGYVLNKDHSIVDTLDVMAIEMVRGHELHLIALAPSLYFSDLTFDKVIPDDGIAFFSGKDRFGLPVDIRKGGKDLSAKHQIKKVIFKNPFNSQEEIIIDYLEWMDSKLGEIPKVVEIIQAEKDTFRFEYTDVQVNIDNLPRLHQN